MGTITIHEATTKRPLQLIGELTGVCWGADVTDTQKNVQRAKECLTSGHLRTAEFPDIYLVIDGYSARVIRELYTHIGGQPTRLQASTRYINYNDFKYITPPSIEKNVMSKEIYDKAMEQISDALVSLVSIGIPREDAALLLPLGMETKMVYKVNFRTLMDMSHNRECSRAYWEFRQLFNDIKQALILYSAEWAHLVSTYFMPKCKQLGYCPEKYSCGKMPPVRRGEPTEVNFHAKKD